MHSTKYVMVIKKEERNESFQTKASEQRAANKSWDDSCGKGLWDCGSKSGRTHLSKARECQAVDTAAEALGALEGMVKAITLLTRKKQQRQFGSPK